jgi:DNA-directed RNA polymerase specialized sigma subunit
MSFKEKINRIKDAIHNVDHNINDTQNELHDAYSQLSEQEKIKLLLQQADLLKDKDKIISSKFYPSI